ncbi:MAG: hypothetical protein ACI8ZM_004435 [Crocinitomix sp.]|jgi:hypothetical protein
MISIKKILLMSISIWMGCQGFSQPFDKLIFKDRIDRNHYSIETIPDIGYAVAGTEFNEENNDIHVFVTDLAGNIMWERRIDESDDDRALDLVFTDNKVVVTGYVNSGPKSELYVVSFDATTGGFLDDFKLISNAEFNQASGGTNIVHNAEENFFIVGGFEATTLKYPLSGNRGLLIKLDASLNLLGTPSYVEGEIRSHTSINDIVQVPDGYFVTGSFGLMPCPGCTVSQVVMAMTITNDLNLMQDLSFHSTNSHQNGVSAVYDSSTDAVYLMSNNSIFHSPQINIITSLSTGTAVHSARFYLPLDPTGGGHNPAGFKLELCPWDRDNLIAAGYYRTDAPGEMPQNDATPWILEFKKNGNGVVSKLLWPAPSEDFYLHGDNVLSTFVGQQPYVFNQEIFTLRSDEQGIVFISPNTSNAAQNYNIELVTTKYTVLTSCFRELEIEVEPMAVVNQYSKSLTMGEIILPNKEPAFKPTDIVSDVIELCNVEDQNEARNAIDGTDDSNVVQNSGFDQALKLNISPNPSSGIFNVELFGKNLNGHLELMNAIGQVVYTSDLLQGDYYVGEIDINNFEEGIYFLTFTNGQNQLIKKVVKI